MDELEARASRRERARSRTSRRCAPTGAPTSSRCASRSTRDTLVSVVDGKPKRSANLLRLANVRAHPAVSVLVDHYDDDWTRLWWVRLDGVAEVVVDGADHEYALSLLEAKYPQYRADEAVGRGRAGHRRRDGPPGRPRHRESDRPEI